MVLGILGLAAMILCWAAGSYWKKVYYLIWFLSLPMPIFWFLYSFSMDEDGDGGSSGGIEAVLTVSEPVMMAAEEKNAYGAANKTKVSRK